MFKITISIILFVNFFVFSQADLPTSFDFTDINFPNGWTKTGTSIYSTGYTPPSLKFDNTNDKLVIHFKSSPGILSYYLKGNSFSNGVFNIEESVNGVDWNLLHSYSNAPAGYQLFTDIPKTASRFIRFIYSNKVNGNIGLDDVKIVIVGPTPEQEINVQYNSINFQTNSNISVSSSLLLPKQINISIQNLGSLENLNFSSSLISGENASDFSIRSQPTLIKAKETFDLTLDFTPSELGSRKCMLTFYTNDIDEPVFNLIIYGIGGDLASEPLSQPFNLFFKSIKTYRISASFSEGNNAEGYLVLKKINGEINEIPEDGKEYQRGDFIGNAQVVSSSELVNFSPNGIEANTNYYFSIFSYNGYGEYRNYLDLTPLKATVKTPVSMLTFDEYYSVSVLSDSFLSDLHNLIYPHQSYNYSDYSKNMVSKFEMRDTIENQRVLTCVYSGENKFFSEPFDWITTGFSREHSYCHNWMPTNPANNPEKPEYEDYHHLFPVNQISANEVRSNYPLGKVISPLSTYLGSKFGFNSKGQLVFEPRDAHKGDVARAIMYMALCYNGVDGYNWKLRNVISPTIQYGQDQSILKEWNFQDQPSNWEIARNDFIDSLQGNRNPFIDRPEFACFIDFDSMTYLKNGCSSSLNEILENNIGIYPNPFMDEIVLEMKVTENLEIQVLDLNSRLMDNSFYKKESTLKLNFSDYVSGVYYLKIIANDSIFIKKIVKK